MMSSFPTECVLDRGFEKESSVEEDNPLFIQRLQKRDAASFDLLFRQYQRMVRSLVFQFLGEREEAADLTQEVFLRIYQNINQFSGSSTLKTWIYRIVVNSALNRKRWWNRRKRGSTVSLEEDSSGNPPEKQLDPTWRTPAPSPEQQASRVELAGLLIKAFARLPLDQRIAVVLRDMEGMSYEEMATLLSLSLGTVKSRIARGRESLRQELSPALHSGWIRHPWQMR